MEHLSLPYPLGIYRIFFIQRKFSNPSVLNLSLQTIPTLQARFICYNSSCVESQIGELTRSRDTMEKNLPNAGCEASAVQTKAMESC